ncbi:cytochrome P450 1A1-like [Brevipalpus obovatus]|uniref:cytochrome P450 1A1-like n=1 Tax=Brevipalpus obovatus TaxID=246614 RepID=UPI003D9EE392
MFIFIIFFIILCAIYPYLTSKYSRSKFRSLPSPDRLPILGHLHLMGKYPDERCKVFDELAKSYGEVYKLQLGQCNYVIIAGIEAAKEALIKNGNACLNRPSITTWNLIARGQKNSKSSFDHCP